LERNFTVVIVKSGDWFAGTVKELSGVHSQGRTIEELKENLKEAVQLIIEDRESILKAKKETEYFVDLEEYNQVRTNRTNL